MCDRIDKLKSALGRASIQCDTYGFFDRLFGKRAMDMADRKRELDRAIEEYNRGECDCAQTEV